jgi:hypothetical protein
MKTLYLGRRKKAASSLEIRMFINQNKRVAFRR